ncbi:NUDIX hydrolase [Leucothrix arctica]|uniref:NUDIX hydrolase n=1 Tax=Leucothrix arctica TaxID=1481894 RepID=A0A317CG17_9GAMM|nr:NUDIX domain-containing protein [Leucothrix arctica]PWQ97524.1 NUDIX hydrolase [Leucothrix arctica]
MKKEIDKLAWLYVRDGKLLTARSKDKTLFYIPGGKREQGETDEQALVREIQEEITVDLVTDTITYAETFKAPADGKNTDIDVKLTCYYADYTGELVADAEIEEIAFIAFEDRHRCSLGSIKAMEWLKAEGLMV